MSIDTTVPVANQPALPGHKLMTCSCTACAAWRVANHIPKPAAYFCDKLCPCGQCCYPPHGEACTCAECAQPAEAAPVGMLPATVRIGHVDYRVHVQHKPKVKGRLVDGRIRYSRARITVARHLGPQAARLTLWHEIMHGILTHAGLTDQSEQVIEALANGVVQVLRDNPELRTP